MKFIKLMKDELLRTKPEHGPKRSRFVWVLDENKYLSLEEVHKLREACRREKESDLRQGKTKAVRDWFMVELGLEAGLRVEEMAKLKCMDLLVDRNQSTLVVLNGKGGRRRTVRINSGFKRDCHWFLKWKREMAQDTGNGGYILTSNKGRHLTKRALQKAFKRCIRKSGLPEHYSIHCLRHTFGSHLYKASNYNLRLVQEQLGHSSIKTTEVYASLMDTDAREAVEKLYKK